jgi:hypothetical protein
VAAADKRPGDLQAPLVHTAQVADRTVQGNAFAWDSARSTWACGAWLARWRPRDPDQAIQVAERL